ncbi:MAG: arginine--tRNA ligase [Planctomycetota bacterium]|nr:MAG: arginine--tRNA ligase [Planctomycetota bacterium]
MKPVIDILDERIGAAMAKAAGGVRGAAMVRPATDPKFGDYQVNGVMPLAKKVQTDPRTVAELIIRTLKINDICEKPEIAGPGFINLRLKANFVADRLLEINADSQKRLGVEKTTQPKTIVVDFSGPNIAKQMHVGHLRSTIIGDCICRLLEFQGHDVKRQNHIGDWGTQFGMLCALFDKILLEAPRGEAINRDETLADIEEFYRQAQSLYKNNEEFARTAHVAVVGLHTGDGPWVTYWKGIVKTTTKHFREVYDRLCVTLKDEHIRGESFYKDMLSDIVAELKKKKLAEESDGAVCVFPEGFKNKEGQPLPFIIQKSDGAYLYATTDLAALRYRVQELKADRIIYVTDARQSLHFQMLFKVAALAGWAKPDMLIHIAFGSVLGENGKPLRTREGENVKLKDLLTEAVERAKAVVEEKNPDLPPERKDEIARAVGIGAVKYADFSNNRTSDYVFSFNKMLAMDGNTAPYMQYAYARIKSIERKGKDRGIDVEEEQSKVEKANLTEPAELDLAKHLVRYVEAIGAAAVDYRPNYLTAYLYELAQKFSAFYTNCPVLDAGADKRPTRLLLCDLTAKTIKHGLSELLGIEVVEQM